jgi:hypothetical protein
MSTVMSFAIGQRVYAKQGKNFYFATVLGNRVREGYADFSSESEMDEQDSDREEFRCPGAYVKIEWEDGKKRCHLPFSNIMAIDLNAPRASRGVPSRMAAAAEARNAPGPSSRPAKAKKPRDTGAGGGGGGGGEGGRVGGGGGASASASASSSASSGASASGEEAGGAPELSVSADNILQKIGEAMKKFAEKTGERLMLLQRVREVTNEVTAAEQELRTLEDLKKHFQLLGHLPVEGGEQVQEQLQEELEEEERNVRQRSAEDSGVSL